jgi:hypothetical protein
VVFGSLGALFACVGVVMILVMGLRLAERRRTLREGLLAEGRCLETFMVHRSSTDGRSESSRYQIVGFETADGREVRARMAAGRLSVVGDFVPVRYLPERPERAVPADASPGPAPADGLAVVALVVFTCVGVFFAASGFGAAGSVTPDFPDEPGWTVPAGEFPAGEFSTGP